jgi:hypothetical protein
MVKLSKTDEQNDFILSIQYVELGLHKIITYCLVVGLNFASLYCSNLTTLYAFVILHVPLIHIPLCRISTCVLVCSAPVYSTDARSAQLQCISFVPSN